MLEQSGIVRSDIGSSFGTAGGRAGSVPMTLEPTVQDLDRHVAGRPAEERL